MDLTTTYLGIRLRTPFVPSASPLSEDITKIRQMEEAGASAVVLHSLFEEQAEVNAAAKAEFRVAPEAYLKHIAEAKRCVKIPIIGSLNCTTLGGWIRYARQIAEAGADALELNIYKIPTRTKVTGTTIEKGYIDVFYRENFFPEVKVDWRTHPDFIGHKNWNGCFRCHDGKHVSADGKMSIKASDCRSCHLILAQGSSEALEQINAKGHDFIHIDAPYAEFSCVDCHTGGPQK